MRGAAMDETREPVVTEKKKAEPLSFDLDREILDWDAYSPPPPPKNRRSVRVQLRYKGRAEPLPDLDSGERAMSDKNALEQAERPKTIRPSPVSEEDVEKDDVIIPTPPPRRSGTIKVRLKYGGRSKPIPVDDPSDD